MKVYSVKRNYENGCGYGDTHELIVVANDETEAISLAKKSSFYTNDFFEVPVTVTECDLSVPSVLLSYELN